MAGAGGGGLRAFLRTTVYDGRDPQAPTRQRFDWPAAGIIEACNEADVTMVYTGQRSFKH